MCSVGKESSRENTKYQAYYSYLVWRDWCLYEEPGNKPRYFADYVSVNYRAV